MKHFFFFLCGLVFFGVFGFAQSTGSDTSLVYKKIPIDGKRWYQLSNVSYDISALTDNVTNENVFTGWGKIINNFDAYYPILDGEEMQIDSIRLYDWQGVSTSNPTYLYAIDSAWNRKLIATFWGDRWAVWVGPNPANPWVYKLDSLVKCIKYLMLRNGDCYPSELQLYGWYKAPTTKAPLTHPTVKLKDMFGVNGYEWNFENGSIDAMKVDTGLLKPIKSFSGFRHYMDWSKLENTEGYYTFSPTHNGGWSYDSIYLACKANNIEVLADLKTIPSWLEQTYPSGSQHYDNIPTAYGNDLTSPASYIKQAKVAFQYAARYGRNTGVDSSLLSVDARQRWFGDSKNYLKIGMDLIKYVECDNERDKWWIGRVGYQTGREYAANLSAFYDGHLHTLGNNVGVKTADSTMQVVMCGVALCTTDYLRGMIDWCKEFRGLKPDGTVNLCWDVINYHYYSSDAQAKPSSYASRGVAPELSLSDSIAHAFLQVAHDYGNDLPVWVTESGYDTSPWSPYHVNAVGTKTVLATQADWILRTSLAYARAGIQKLFYYQLYDDNSYSGAPYATSGLLNNDRSRRPSADYIKQANQQFGEYAYSQTLSLNPLADEYALNDSTFMYTVYMPTASAQTANYTLDLGTADSAIIYTPTIGSDTLVTTKLKTSNGKLTLLATETPVFITGFGIVTDTSAGQRIATPPTPLLQSLKATKPTSLLPTNSSLATTIYPNPASKSITITTPNLAKLTIVSNNGHIVYEQKQFKSNRTTINLSTFPKGWYLVQTIDNQHKSNLKKLLIQ